MGGDISCLVTNALTREAKPCFPMFSYGHGWFFLAKVLPCPLNMYATVYQGKNWTFFPGSNFSRGSNFDIFSGNCKISKITVLNCYLAVNCPKPTPQSHFGTFPEGSTIAPGVEPPTPPSIFTLLYIMNVVWATDLRQSLRAQGSTSYHFA